MDQKNALLNKLTDLSVSLTKEEMDQLVSIFQQDMKGELKHLKEFAVFHYLASKYPDPSYSHEVHNIRQNYIFQIKDKPELSPCLPALYIYNAEYYYSLQIYSQCIRNLFIVLENRDISAQMLSTVTSILFAVLSENNLYEDCLPYMEKLKKAISEDPGFSPTTLFIMEMAFMELYGFLGRFEESEAYYRKLVSCDPIPEGISPFELALLEFAHLGIEALSKKGTEPSPSYIEKVIDVCMRMSSEGTYNDSNYSVTLLPMLRFIRPCVSNEQLIRLYESFPRFVYAKYDLLHLYSYLFEEGSFKPEDAPELYGKYVELLKHYYRTNQHNQRMAIANEMLAQTMESEYRVKAVTDRLTGLGNRQSYSELFQQYSRISSPIDPNLCIVMMDLDNLKKYNDSLGHEVGDRMLVEAANSIKNAFGNDAKLFRYGGDEFVAVLHSTKEKVDGILRKLEACCHENDSGLSISAGYAFCSDVPGEMDNESRMTQMIKLADSRMYAEKERRRTR